MFDIDIKNVKKGRNIYYPFIAIGIILLLILLGIFISNISKLNGLDAKVISVNVKIKSDVDSDGTIMYSPVYYYIVDDKEYICSSNTSSNIYPETENKTVYYDSKNPSDCMTEYSKSSNFIILIGLIIPLIFIVIGVINIKKVNKRIKVILDLNQNGKLVKKIPYTLENTGIVINDIPIQRQAVEYTLPSGINVILYGDSRYDKKHFDSDGMVDLLIDENNPDNYYIDYEINRLSGNLPQDYYQQQITQNNQGNFQ